MAMPWAELLLVLASLLELAAMHPDSSQKNAPGPVAAASK